MPNAISILAAALISPGGFSLSLGSDDLLFIDSSLLEIATSEEIEARWDDGLLVTWDDGAILDWR